MKVLNLFNSTFSLYLLSITSILFSGLVDAQADPYNPSPLETVGYLDAAHCDDPSDVLSGGSIRVNGITIKIPKNLLVGLPSITISWAELFKAGSSDEPNLPMWGARPYEASVLANKVNGQYIAGIIYIFPGLLHGSGGFINFIDYDAAELRIGGTMGDRNSGNRVVINDPVGRFGKPYTDWPLMAADTENPSVKASTGFPMCFPRFDPATKDDPLCPKKNRPLTGGVARTVFTFGSPPVASGQPDPNLMAPLMVGDYVTYSGAWVSSDLIAAYSIEANLGLYTAPGTKPAYATIEEVRWGIIGNAAGEIAETRVVGYTTDPSSSLNVYAIDVDPCTGVKTKRTLAVVVPRPNGRLGQWRYRTDTDVGPSSREVGVDIETGQVETGNGIIAGQFITPVMDGGFIFPELNTFGNPEIPFDFQELSFLAHGSGPWQGGIPGGEPNPSGPIVGQLSPWPGSPKPTVPTCDPTPPPQVPKANAGSAQTVLTNTRVSLSGKSDTTTIPESAMTYKWEQIDTTGVTVTLAGANTKLATFVTPTTITGTSLVLKFKLTITTSTGTSSATVDITVTSPSRVDTITIVSQNYSSSKGAGILVVRARSSVTDGSSVLSMRTVNPNTPVTKMNSLGNGVYELQVNVKPRPDSFVITSNMGATITRAVN